VGALDREQKRASIAQNRASTANIYDQMASRATAAREAALTATSEQDEVKLKATADTEQALGIKQLAEELITTRGGSAAIGFGTGKFFGLDPIAGTSRADFEAKATRLSNLLTLDNLKLMSGVLTDRDIQLLATAGSNLSNFDMSQKQYVAEINRVIENMDRTISNNGITAEQAVFFGAIDEGDATNLDAIWDNL